MAYFLAGLAVLIAVIVGLRLLQKADPKRLASAMRTVVGVGALVLATFLTVRGALPLAIPLGIFGLALLGLPTGGSGFGLGRASKSPGQRSQVRTETLEMVLDHDSGDMEGRCLKGRFEGRALSALSDSDLLTLLDELRGMDDQGAALLEAYLDWRLPSWRDGEVGGDNGAQEGRRRRAAAARMGPEEAYAVLGLEEGASDDDIRRAHRALMKKLHPDQGGSNYLAARINEAKEVLLGHR